MAIQGSYFVLSKLFTLSLIFTFKNIHPSGNFKGKIILNHCAGMGMKIVVEVAIDHTGYHFKKKLKESNYSSGFLRSFYLTCLTFGYIWNSSSTAYAAKC